MRLKLIPVSRDLHNAFVPLNVLKGGLQWDPNSSLHYAAAYITDRSCGAGEKPEAPLLPLTCPFAQVLNHGQGPEHLRWHDQLRELSDSPALSHRWLGYPGSRQAPKQQLPGESLPPRAGEWIPVSVKEQAVSGATNQQRRTQHIRKSIQTYTSIGAFCLEFMRCVT